MVSSIRRDPASEHVGGAIAWLRARPWTYAYAVLVLWALVPELRRVIDWKSSFSSVSLVSIVPLLSLLPAAAAFFYTARAAKLQRPFVVAAWMWCGAFGYAYAIGLATGNAAAATYTLLGFILPMFFGMYVATMDVPIDVAYERIASFALALSVPVALYAFFQYAFPPPWDLYWIQQANLVNVGTAAAFAFRPFATLNGPGPFADFLALVLVLNLPRLRAANVLRLSAIALNVAALALTLVRADWLALALAVLVFVALGPRKFRNLSFIGVAAIALALFGSNAAALLGNSPAGIQLQSRFESLNTITTDSSFLDRQLLFGNALSTALAEPTGEGLGVTGTAAKLGARGATADFDNGYIARLTEMGYFGTLVYLLTIVLMLAYSIGRWRAANRAKDLTAASIVSAAIAIQVALVFLDVSGDHHAQLSGIFFWLSYAFVFGASRRNELADN